MAAADVIRGADDACHPALAKLNDLGSYEFEEQNFDFATVVAEGDCIITEEDGSLVRSTKIFPLRETYSLWWQDVSSILWAKKSGNYAEGLTKVSDIKSVQDFWRLWNNLSEASGCLSLFRSPVQPLWEDKNNEGGGRWILPQMGVGERFNFFTDICLAMVGGTFRQLLDENDEILGASFHVYKKMWKIEIWNKKGASNSVRKLDLALRDLLQVTGRDAFSIKYSSHDGKRTETWLGVNDEKPQEEL
ncbi:unnamed protein product [Amoebophrya sp. A25]|nr:unnamed protein product [Amoebophrya sp. A25]|eukprot:GSA25T00016144001.1